MKEERERLASEVIGAAIEIHRRLGPGLLESVYRRCLCWELHLRGIPHAAEIPLDVEYKGVTFESAYRMDLLVAGEVMVEHY